MDKNNNVTLYGTILLMINKCYAVWTDITQKDNITEYRPIFIFYGLMLRSIDNIIRKESYQSLQINVD